LDKDYSQVFSCQGAEDLIIDQNTFDA